MASLYNQDLVRWSEEQARLLRSAARAGSNAPVDWEHVAEEIESLGITERRALASHIATVVEHLLKLQASPATESVRGRKDTIRRARSEIDRLLADSPSLRREITRIIANEVPRMRSLVRDTLQDHGEDPLTDIDALTYTETQVLGAWMPERA